MNPAQRVERIEEAKFRVFWEGVEGSELELDFKPIVVQFNLDARNKDYCLLHWQARPRGLRRWGCYDRASDSYNPFNFDSLPYCFAPFRTLQIPEGTLPNAVLWVRGRLRRSVNEHLTIKCPA